MVNLVDLGEFGRNDLNIQCVLRYMGTTVNEIHTSFVYY
jgi:hypothetical protein